MQYEERYVLKYRRKERDGSTHIGQFGPYDDQESALAMMRRIEKRHDHVKTIYWASVYRVSEVVLATYSRAVD